MYNLKIESDLNLPHQQSNPRLSKLIRGSIKRKNQLPETDPAPCSIFWDATQFCLHRSSLYSKLSSEAQGRILQQCNDLLMSDFYYLEKSGLAYCAKMILLAQTTEVRQIYALIACDEATHLEWFTPYVPVSLRTHPQSKLMHVLCKIIDECDANSLYYLVQTIIEGWGVSVYAALAKPCLSEPFKNLLLKILQDEMIHHKTGEALFDPRQVDKNASHLILDRLFAYAEVLRVGPQLVVQSIEQECGELDKNTLETLFSDLRTEAVSTVKLSLLKTLMAQPGMERYITDLEQDNAFKAYTPADCAKIYVQMRHQPDMF